MLRSLADRGARDRRAVLIAVLVFSVCSMTAAIRSSGFLEADGATHYLFARFAFSHPYYFVDVWGRPLITALFCIPARFGGVLAVRFVSLAAAIACGLIAYFLARGQKYPWPSLATICTLGMPLVFLHSIAELTELPFAVFAGLAMLAYQRRRWLPMAICAALSPLARPEGLALLALAALALIFHRRLLWLVVLPIPLAVWSLAGHLLVGPADHPWYRWLVEAWPYDAISQYPRGSIFHFLMRLPMLVGPFVFPAMWIGMALGLSRWRELLPTSRDAPASPRPRHELSPAHLARCDFLLAALPLSILLAHSVIFALGRLSSSGETRYLLVFGPLWGVITARGWAWIFQTLQWKRPTPWAALAVVVPGLVNFAWRVLPLEPSPSWEQAQRIVAWYESSPLKRQYPRLLSNHPGVLFYLDQAGDVARLQSWRHEAITDPGPGDMLLWDPEYCVRNADARYTAPLALVMRSGWIDDWRSTWQSNVNNPPPWANYKIFNPPKAPKTDALPDEWMLWHIFLSPRDIEGHPTGFVIRQRDALRWRERSPKPGYASRAGGL